MIGAELSPKNKGLNVEGGNMSNEHLHSINAECHGCMDGRPVLFKAQKEEGVWQKVVEAGAEAAKVVEAKLPGGALGFIAVLEKHAGLTQDEAIEVTEVALQKMGMQPQFHLDNDHGHFDIEGKNSEEVNAFLDSHTGGCGFAGRIWGDGAPSLLNKLKNRGWLVEVLNGNHQESEAKNIDREGAAIHTHQATESNEQSFTFNRPETQKALGVLSTVLAEKQLGKREKFISESMSWFNSEFSVIAQLLRNIDTVSTVV